MKFSLYLITFIYICILPEIYSQKKGPGCAGCCFFGTAEDMCGEVIPASKLPAECESIFFYGIHTDATLEINDHIDGVSNRAFIDDVDSVGKPVFLYYGRTNVDEWMDFLACVSQNGGASMKTEMANLKTYLGQFKNVAGLVLKHLSIDPDEKVIPDFSANLKIYIDELKKNIPNYSIGMEIIGRQLIDLYSSNTPKWLDFQVLDPCIDFYTLDLFYFNDCTPDFKVGGTSPQSGNKGRTLDQLVAAALKAGIPKSKTYFGYRSGGTKVVGGDLCKDTSTEICKKKTLDGFCSDNTQTFFDKGTFAKNNGVGFVMTNTDVSDDPNSVCKCETAYPAFHDVLAGFKGLPVPKPCPLLDKC